MVKRYGILTATAVLGLGIARVLYASTEGDLDLAVESDQTSLASSDKFITMDNNIATDGGDGMYVNQFFGHVPAGSTVTYLTTGGSGGVAPENGAVNSVVSVSKEKRNVGKLRIDGLK